MVLPVAFIVAGVVMDVWADVNVFCRWDSLWSGRVGARSVATFQTATVQAEDQERHGFMLY